ncbi:TIGR02117 family protein [Sphingomonas sp. LR60]|uniref:TIGR02117 family protein n=1 Tax=Sphingomonas sp. LR60 TaxID=3050233 RepID=UPI002FE16E50
MKRLATIAARALGVLAIVAFVYLLAGTALSTIPRNRDWHAPTTGGVTIWIEDNGVHTGIVMPKVAAGIDWRSDFPAADLPDPRFAANDHVAIGWGERNFFLGTPTWSDVRPVTVLHAAFGSDETLLHVEHIPRPQATRDVRAVVLRPDEYRRLATAIRASRASGPAIRGYAGYDAFYPGAGRYDALRTCNAWTGDRLADAGVKIGWWTPFSASVMQWFERATG